VVNQTSYDCVVVCRGPGTTGELNLEGWNDLAISSNSLKCQWPFGGPFKAICKIFILHFHRFHQSSGGLNLSSIIKKADGNELIILYIYCVQLDLDIRH